MRITTDYLVIGAGASGLAFTDTLVAHVDVILVDRKDAHPVYVMDQFGHTDPNLALRIYTKVVGRRRRGHGERLVGVLAGVEWAPRPIPGLAWLLHRSGARTKKPRTNGAFARWAVLGSNQ